MEFRCSLKDLYILIKNNIESYSITQYYCINNVYNIEICIYCINNVYIMLRTMVIGIPCCFLIYFLQIPRAVVLSYVYFS